tara:strand:+ start:283 stop:459 length:177 start_codon:yes stop_codon:yes gene_type:complete
MFLSGLAHWEAEELQQLAMGLIQSDEFNVPALTNKNPFFSRTKVNIWEPHSGQKALIT